MELVYSIDEWGRSSWQYFKDVTTGDYLNHKYSAYSNHGNKNLKYLGELLEFLHCFGVQWNMDVVFLVIRRFSGFLSGRSWEFEHYRFFVLHHFDSSFSMHVCCTFGCTKFVFVRSGSSVLVLVCCYLFTNHVFDQIIQVSTKCCAVMSFSFELLHFHLFSLKKTSNKLFI